MDQTRLRTIARNRTAYHELRDSDIRLIRVKPDSWSKRPSCTLHHIPLDARPEYVALSYAWGSGGETEKIFLNGREHKVTKSLKAALRRFRQLCSLGREFDGFTFREGMYLWAVAICINQQDEREKEREIPRMRDIYTLSSRVCAWLGENKDDVDDSTRRGLQLVLESDWFLSSFDVFRSGVREKNSEAFHSKWKELEPAGFCLEDTVDVLYDLANRDWFYRVWVIQEAALPVEEPILIAGRFLFRFDRFVAFCALVGSNLWNRGPAWQLVHHLALLRSRGELQLMLQNGKALENHQKQFGRAFEAAILRMGGGVFDASESHDFIYGMIGLCGGKKMMPPALAPNYRKSFPKVCEDYARYIIESTGSVAILRRHDRSSSDDFDNDDGDVPSWVPNFCGWLAPTTASDADPSAVSFVGPYGRLLKVRGFEIGEVTAVYFPLGWEDKKEDSTSEEESDEDYDIGDHFRHHNRFLSQVADERNVPHDLVVVTWLARIASQQSPPRLPLHTLMQWHYTHVHQDDSDPPPGQSPDNQTAFKNFIQLARIDLTDRIKLLCPGGFVARPGRRVRAQRGDHLVALSGSCDPFLLRPTLTVEGPGFTLLSYCDGYDGFEKLKFKRDDFQVCSRCNDRRKVKNFIIS